MGFSNDIYNLTNGRVRIGSMGISNRNSWFMNYSEAIWNYSAQGARDTENNAYYDAGMKLQRTVSVLSAVGYTHEENVAHNAYRSIDWNNKQIQAHLSRIGAVKTIAQAAAADMLNNAEFVDSNGKPVSKLSGRNLPNTQKSQLAMSGTFSYGGTTVHIKNYSSLQVRTIMQDAKKEKESNILITSAGNHLQQRASLLELKSKQVAYLSTISSSKGFNGSLRATNEQIYSLKNEINDLCRQKESLQSQIKCSGSNSVTDAKLKKIDAEIAQKTQNLHDFEFYKDTGAKAVNGGGSGAQMRHFGRTVIIQKALGSDGYQGMVFYKNAAKLTVNSVKIAAKSVVGVTTFATGAVAAPVVKVAPNTMVANHAKRIADGSKNINTNFNKAIRHKTKEEKVLESRKKRQKRSDNRELRINKRTDKLNTKINALEAKQTAGSMSVKDKRKLDRLNCQNRVRNGVLTRVNNTNTRWKNIKTGAGRINQKWKNSKVHKIIALPGKTITGIINLGAVIKRKLIMACAALAGGFLIFLVLNMGIIVLIGAVASFFSSNPVADLSQELAEVNYTQLIVNQTVSDLGKEFTETAINDAETHFLLQGSVSSDGLSWTKGVNEGQISHIWATEELIKQQNERRELSGVSANLLPIISLMHYRYNEDIDYDNYLTARAYVYYMYVLSHSQLCSDDGKTVYSYTNQDDCDVIYESSPVYNYDGTVTRGNEICSNVYIHGYSSNYNKTINQLRANLGDFLTSTISGLSINASLSNKENGVWIDEIPSDSSGVCNNYIAYKAGENFLNDTCPGEEHDHEAEGCHLVWDCGLDEYAGHMHGVDCYDTVLVCGHDEHHHSSSCYSTRTVTVDETVEVTRYKKYRIRYDCGDTDTINESEYLERMAANPSYYDYCPKCDGEYYVGELVEVEGLDEYTENLDTGYEYEETYLDCDLDEHTHNGDCYGRELTCTLQEDTGHNHAASGCTKSWSCGKDEHTHSEWISVDNPGCFRTAYVCQGHCGQHVSPNININVDMTWETLISHDGFKTCYFLTNTDFSNGLFDTGTRKTIDEWQDEWINKFKCWFFPFPNSPISALEWKYKKVFDTGLSFVNWISGNGWVTAASSENTEIDDKDVFGFEGWFNADGTINQDLFSDLKDLYGDWYNDNYQQGIDTWMDFEVVFPSAFGGGFGGGAAICSFLSTSQTESVIAQVKQANPGINERQLAVIKEALSGVGKYYYVLSGEAHLNAINNTSGAGECSGFISGVLSRSLGENFNNSAAGYHSLGISRVKQAGDIISVVNYKGEAGNNHVMLYLGYLSSGVQGSSTNTDQSGEGLYVIECSPVAGGSCLRKISDDELSLYDRCWNGY